MDTDFQTRYLDLPKVFTPHAPIGQADLFAGRTQHLARIIEAVSQKGRHIVLFGERGVGKTSLARVFHDFLAVGEQETVSTIIAPFVVCNSSDDFSSIWRKVFKQIEVVENKPKMGFVTNVDAQKVTMASKLEGEVTIDRVVAALQFLAESKALVVVVVDEFDRVKDKTVTTRFADTIKTLSDLATEVTLVVVGVADNVTELMQDHASVERACLQLRMPRMSAEELRQVVHNGLKATEMTIEKEALAMIVAMSQGLPHYTHLLALLSGQAAVGQRRAEIGPQDVVEAVRSAIGGTQESIANAYSEATASSRESLYPKVLLACALAQTDSRGTFVASDIREPLSKIAGKPLETAAFSRNLSHLCDADRGPALERVGVASRARFRFANPLMQPFVIMKGVNGGFISEEELVDLGMPTDD